MITACDKQLSEKEKSELIASVEARVRLPQGAEDLSCYQRRYLFRKDEWGPNKGKMALIGHFERSAKPGAILVQSESDMAKVVDQGCHTMTIHVPLDDNFGPVEVGCFPEFDGTPPQGARRTERLRLINKLAGECTKHSNTIEKAAR
jgi:hypothetical protein